MDERLLSVPEVAERLGVSRATVHRWCREGRFRRAQYVGESPRGIWVIPEGDVESVAPPRRGRPPSTRTDEGE